jgi:hypothetical protein
VTPIFVCNLGPFQFAKFPLRVPDVETPATQEATMRNLKRAIIVRTFEAISFESDPSPCRLKHAGPSQVIKIAALTHTRK